MSFKLNRFSEARQDQVEQLVAYAELLGLSGRDLVSIGSKMDRDKTRLLKESNMVIVRGFNCLPIGKDKPDEFNLGHRFKLKSTDGDYNFVNANGWNTWEITSLRTKDKRLHSVDLYEYDLPKTTYHNKARYSILLDISSGKLTLNF